jgi:hypothetical protein
MKEITIDIDTDGTASISLKGFERESPRIAAIFEKALGKVEAVDWKPRAHAHVHIGGGDHRH